MGSMRRAFILPLCALADREKSRDNRFIARMTLRDDVLRNAVIAHQAGRLEEAEEGYRRILLHRPSHPQALYSLGLLHFQRGDIESALQCARGALEHAPTNGRFWNTLGSILIAARRNGEARDAYRRATEVEPAMAEAWYNLGICLRNESEYEAAIGCLREALTRPPPFGGAYEALAMLLYELGRSQEAAQIGTLWLARDPSNAKAQHVAASMSGENVPARASDEYVREHFDAAAAGFDNNLRQLEYRAPELVANALARNLIQRALRPSRDPDATGRSAAGERRRSCSMRDAARACADRSFAPRRAGSLEWTCRRRWSSWPPREVRTTNCMSPSCAHTCAKTRRVRCSRVGGYARLFRRARGSPGRRTRRAALLRGTHLYARITERRHRSRSPAAISRPLCTQRAIHSSRAAGRGTVVGIADARDAAAGAPRPGTRFPRHRATLALAPVFRSLVVAVQVCFVSA